MCMTVEPNCAWFSTVFSFPLANQVDSVPIASISMKVLHEDTKSNIILNNSSTTFSNYRATVLEIQVIREENLHCPPDYKSSNLHVIANWVPHP